MSKANRKREYERIKANGKLSQDDGSLEKEFGTKKMDPNSKSIPKGVKK